MNLARAVFLILLSTALTADAVSAVVSAVSPDGKNEIGLDTSDGLSVNVRRGGRTLVPSAPIGMTFADRKIGFGQVKSLGVEKTPDGTRVTFEGGYAVRLVATDEGVAYRFETSFGGRVKVLDETWRLPIAPSVTNAYFCYYCGPQKFDDQYQNGRSSPFERHAPTEIEGNHRLIQAPFTLRYDDGRMLVASVTDVRDYPFAIYERDVASASPALKAVFGRWPKKEIHTDNKRRNETGPRLRFCDIAEYEDYLVETDGTRTYPYHTYQLADAPKDLVGNRLIAALAKPPEGDFSWVRPGKVAWDWWNAWHNRGNANCTTEAYLEYIDFAAAEGLEYVILDEGWSEDLNIWKFNPRVDVPRLIAYAKGKGVGIVLWMAWDQAVDDEKRVVEHFAKLGAAGVKVDFMQRCDAREVRFEETFTRLCAEHRLIVDFHGQPIPGGLHQTYPNLLNYEGVHGLEQFKSYRGQDMPLQDVRLVFTRMCQGPLDYTPGAMDNYPIGGYKGTNRNPGSLGTRVHQMALMTLFESPFLMLCDSPAKYRANPECLKFMAGVPTVWDESVGLGGDPDTYAILARRKGDVWYVAGVTDSHAREVVLDTSFLKSGDWTAEVFCDAPDSDTLPTHYRREVKSVRSGDRLSVRFAPGGGWTARFTRL